jgi:hypothetical protein
MTDSSIGLSEPFTIYVRRTQPLRNLRAALHLPPDPAA